MLDCNFTINSKCEFKFSDIHDISKKQSYEKSILS